jgi:hypothetical protein
MDSSKPVAKLRLGRISAAIWKNDTDKGSLFNVSFQRTYKEGEEFKNSQSFGRDDLLVLAKLADQAHTKIHELQNDSER